MVPRSFLGPIAVSSFAYPAVMILKMAGTSKLWSQLVGNLHCVNPLTPRSDHYIILYN